MLVVRRIEEDVTAAAHVGEHFVPERFFVDGGARRGNAAEPGEADGSRDTCDETERCMDRSFEAAPA